MGKTLYPTRATTGGDETAPVSLLPFIRKKRKEHHEDMDDFDFDDLLHELFVRFRRGAIRGLVKVHIRRDLDIEIGFLAGLVRRDPEYVEALRVLESDPSVVLHMAASTL